MDLKLEKYRTAQFIDTEMLKYPDIISHAVTNMKRSVVDKLISEMEIGKCYVVKMDQDILDDYDMCRQKRYFDLTIREIPAEQMYFYRDVRIVDVDALEIESINCKNCAAPIPVGVLDRSGDTLVRCSYCGTYHTIRRGDNG